MAKARDHYRNLHLIGFVADVPSYAKFCRDSSKAIPKIIQLKGFNRLEADSRKKRACRRIVELRAVCYVAFILRKKRRDRGDDPYRGFTGSSEA